MIWEIENQPVLGLFLSLLQPRILISIVELHGLTGFGKFFTFFVEEGVLELFMSGSWILDWKREMIL